MNSDLTSIPQNYRGNVDWVIQAYSDADVSFSNGFQKDAIQNSVGAKRHGKWKNWHCDISVIRNSKGTFVVVEDSGTVGLTGRNISSDEINEMMGKNIKLPGEERLARFTSMYNSGDQDGPGLYGAGKSVFSVASKDYTYVFDSLRDDNKYVANINQSGRVHPFAYEDDEAEQFILEETGFPRKTTCGTRVIIKNPKDELIESIEKGSIIPNIQEAWWRIISRFDDTCSITVNGTIVEVPDNIKKGATHFYELPSPYLCSPERRIKNFGFYLFEDGSNRWKGISYYRRGMKIGEVDIKNVPAQLVDKFWGYVEVDEPWEAELSIIEDRVHFGVSKRKKIQGTYQELKNFCNDKVTDLLKKWNYIKEKEDGDKKLQEEMQLIANDLQGLFDSLGFEDLGKGPKKADFDIRWQDIKYPHADSVTVHTNDVINFSFRINSRYSTKRKYEYRVYVIDPETKKIKSTIQNSKIAIESEGLFKKHFSFVVSNDNAERYAENRIILEVQNVESNRKKARELPFFYDIDKPHDEKESVEMALHDYTPPTDGSRRVDFGDSIKDICYLIENKRSVQLHYRLNISIHNAEDVSYPKIIDLSSTEGVIPPFEEIVTDKLDPVVIDESVFSPFLSKGIVELRARLICTEDDGINEKGDKLTHFYFKLFLNCDEKNGQDDAFERKLVNDPENPKRSWNQPGVARTIFFNIGHNAYLLVKDDDELRHSYLMEQMLKQYVLLYLSENRYGMFSEDGQDFADMDPKTAAESVIDKIEQVYWESLK